MSSPPSDPPADPDSPAEPADPSTERLLFETNLAEFAREVGFIVALEQNEKVSADEAYRRIRELWRELKHTRKSLYRPEHGTDDHGPSESCDG
ncbi:MAG: hypothetical protein AAF078_00515 [Planctomycetota bacterium]